MTRIAELAERGALLYDICAASQRGVSAKNLRDVVDELGQINAELREIMGPVDYHQMAARPRGGQVPQYLGGGW
jgi:hypothetical protein